MKLFQVTPTINTAPYASGDQVGGLISFGEFNAKTGIIQAASILDLDKQNAALDLIFFKSSVTLAANNDVFVLSAADELHILPGYLSFTTYKDLGANGSISAQQAIGIPVPLMDATGILYGALISRGTPTYTSASRLTVTIGVVEYVE